MLRMAGAALATMLTLVFVPPAIAVETTEFSGTYTGTFTIEDRGSGDHFMVHDSGNGAETTVPLGAFSQQASVHQDGGRSPDGCGFGSTGSQGKATITFADGSLHLTRLSGEGCFAFPFVTAHEAWVISGGTGAYRAARGNATRNWKGDVRNGEVSATWSGSFDRP